MRNATGQEDRSGSVRDAARAISCRAEPARGHGTATTTGTWTQMERSRRCIRSQPRNNRQRRCRKQSRGRGGSQSGGDGRTGGRHHHQSEKRDQLNSNSKRSASTSGKTAGCCEDRAHASSHTDDQETSEVATDKGQKSLNHPEKMSTGEPVPYGHEGYPENRETPDDSEDSEPRSRIWPHHF